MVDGELMCSFGRRSCTALCCRSCGRCLTEAACVCVECRVDEKRGVETEKTPKDEATPQDAEKPKKDKAKKAK